MTLRLLIAFLVSGVATLGVAAVRAVVVRFKADDCLHLADADVGVVQRQRVAAHRLDIVDAWGKPLTVITAMLGIASYVAWWMGK